MWYRIRPSLTVCCSSQEVCLIGDQIHRFTLSRNSLSVFSILTRKCGASNIELFQVAGNAEAAFILKTLRLAQVLQQSVVPFANYKSDTYFDAALDIPTSSNKICDASIAIIGCGGLGSSVAQHLASSGVKSLTIVDHDYVEDKNIANQYLYQLSDVGRPKVVAAREQLLKRYPLVEVIPIQAYVESETRLESISDYTLQSIVCCADTPKRQISLIVSKLALKAKAIYATCSVGIHNGTWGPIVRPHNLESFVKFQMSRNESSGLCIESLSSFAFGPTNTIVASALSRDLLHAIAGEDVCSVNAQVILDFNSYKSSVIPLVDYDY